MNIWKWFLNLFKRKEVVQMDINFGDANKKAIVIGANNYSGSQLQGCVNDSLEWKKLLEEVYGFKCISIIEEQETKNNVLEALNKLITEAKEGDSLVFQYSGHGTSVRDNDGDEEDGRDEALYLRDGNVVVDDEIRKILDKLPKNVKLTFVSDSCYSGSISRAFLRTMNDSSFYSVPKIMPPKDDMDAVYINSLPLKKTIFYPEDNMNHVVLTGTNSSTYSFDALIENKYMGAFSYYAIKVIREKPDMTYAEFEERMKQFLPNDRYPQYPQVESKKENKDKKLFC
jgi:hypothetical protein